MSPTAQPTSRCRTTGSHRPRRTAHLPAPRPVAAALPEQLVIDVRLERGGPLLVVSGELDVATAPLLDAVLEHLGRTDRAAGRPPRRVEVDLREVRFADSSGLRPLLDRPVLLRAVPAGVQRVLAVLAGTPTASVPAGGPGGRRG